MTVAPLTALTSGILLTGKRYKAAIMKQNAGEQAEDAASDAPALTKEIKKGEYRSMEGYQELKELWILKDCKQDTCRDFIQYGKIVTYPRNRFCIRAREENSNIFFILEGKVQIYNLTKCGKKKILFVLGKHNIANESLVADFNTIFCETLEKCSFFVIRKDRMMQLMEQDFALTKNLFRYQERKLWRLGHQLEKYCRQYLSGEKTCLQTLEAGKGFWHPVREGN